MTAGLIARVARTMRGATMLDIIMLAVGLGFFALSIGYAGACDHL
jgi:hypothetical protein